jgi:dipeptidyl aminopeptidase/acylaminoacyl peptidase
MTRWFAAFFFALLATATIAAEPIVVTDLLRIRTAGAIEVARDGSKAIVVVNSIAELPTDEHAHEETDENNEPPQPCFVNQSHLWLIPLFDANAAAMQLTFGNRNDSQPKLSPDGARIAFVRKGEDAGDGHGEPQVWVISTQGGEARQVTHFEHGASQPEWLPNGRQVLVTSSVPMDELDGVPAWPMDRPKRSFGDDELPEGVEPKADGTKEQIRAWLARHERDNDPRLITRLDFHDEQALRENYEFAHVFIVEVDGDAAAPRRVTSGFCDHESAAVMPDGKAIVYAAKKPTDKHPDRVLHTDLWMINVDGTNDRALLALEGWSLGRPIPSRDGAVIAFTATRTDEPAYRLSRLGVVPTAPQAGAADAGAAPEPTWLTDDETQHADVFDFAWNPAHGASIVFNTASEGAYPLMTISFGLLEPAVLVREFENTPVGVFQFGVGGGAIVYARSTFANPCEVRVSDANGDRALLDLNPWTRDKTLSHPTEGWITRPDGTRVQYWLLQPTLLKAKEKYPLVLEMHGGPMWMWGPGEPSMWLEFQLLCSFGYGVAYANPRGSTGYGRAFQRGNFQDWGEGPAGDVLAVLDKVILEQWVDKDRLLLTGGSYAGYLTAWIVGNDHRFKAAVAQRGVYDFATFFGEGNAWRLVEWTFGGLPFEARLRDVIARNNPFSFAGRVRTPLLIMHASSDLRTGVSQSEMMYRALKAQGKPAEYARYPDAGHDLSRTGDPTQRMDRLLRIIEFFDRHIDNPRPAPQVGATTESTSSMPSATSSAN